MAGKAARSWRSWSTPGCPPTSRAPSARLICPTTVTPKGIGVQLDFNNGIDLDIAVDSVSW
jgi:hypothetical protein